MSVDIFKKVGHFNYDMCKSLFSKYTEDNRIG